MLVAGPGRRARRALLFARNRLVGRADIGAQMTVQLAYVYAPLRLPPSQDATKDVNERMAMAVGHEKHRGLLGSNLCRLCASPRL
jgi:hypothetical protein